MPETSQLPQADSSGQPKIPNAMPNVVIDGGMSHPRRAIGAKS